jgi:hypothetical protein
MWDQQIYSAVLEIIRTGGNYGLLGLAMYLVVPFLKVLFIGILFYKAVLKLIGTITNLYLVRKMHKDSKIQLLSEKVSQELSGCIKGWQEEQERLNDDFLKQVKDFMELKETPHTTNTPSSDTKSEATSSSEKKSE